jgi:FemAB-related protein (PEP-CTERM system-associated)
VTETSQVTVRLAADSDLPAWQEFVDAMPDAGCMHHAGWFRLLREAYRVEPYFFVAVDSDGSVIGVLPTYLTRSWLAGSHISSLEDGVLARRPEATGLLMEAARAVRDRVRAQYLQMRGGPVDIPGTVSSPTVRTIIETHRGPDALWAAVKKKTRWGVRQAQKQDLVVEHDSALAGLEAFYATYAAHMRDLGTPVFGVDVFRALREHLGRARLRLYVVRYRARLIGGMLCIVNPDRWTDYYAVVRPSRETEFANYLLYWHVIRDASAHGVARLDLGRSTPGSTVHAFKRKWGGIDVDVLYHFYPALHARPRDMGLVRLKRGKGLVQRVWSHLPLPIANRLGPRLRTRLPFI